MVDIRSEIDELVRTFVDDLEALVRRAALESVTQALEAGTTKAAAPNTPRAAITETPRRARSSSSKSGKEQLARTLVDYLGDNPGARMEQIKVAVGSEPRLLRPIINKLLEKDIIRKEGEKRATRYFLGKND